MVAPSYYPAKGGTETVVRNLSISLNKKNIHTDVMTFNADQSRNTEWHGKIERIDGFSVFRISGLNLLRFFRSDTLTMKVNVIPGRFTKILKGYDIIHFHELDFSFPFFSVFVKKPKILHFHGIYVQYLKRYHLSRMLMKHSVDYYISISRQMTEELVDLGINKNKILYLPNGVDTDAFKPYVPKEDNLLLFVGRVAPNKGLHILLESLRFLEKPIRLAIIGPVDSIYHPYIMKLVEEENQKGKHEITFLGAMDQMDIVTWYQKASIFILPSFCEGFPVTVLEALSCETPVIATPVGGIPEIVKDYKTGILIPLNNPAALAQAIQHLLDNKEARRRFGREGRKQVIENYSLEASVEKLIKIYKQIVS